MSYLTENITPSISNTFGPFRSAEHYFANKMEKKKTQKKGYYVEEALLFLSPSLPPCFRAISFKLTENTSAAFPQVFVINERIVAEVPWKSS